MPKKVYDLEAICDDIQAILEENLNDKIEEIDNEKGDDIKLKPVNSEAYFFQTLDERVANYDPFILYGLDDMNAEGIGPATAEKPIINVVLSLVDNGQVGSIGKRVLRYQRAIKETLQDHWDQSGQSMKFRVTGLVPVEYRMLNSSNTYRAIGVTIETELA